MIGIWLILSSSGCTSEGIVSSPFGEGQGIESQELAVSGHAVSLENHISVLVDRFIAHSGEIGACEMPSSSILSVRVAALQVQYRDLPDVARSSMGTQNLDEVLEEYEAFNAAGQDLVNFAFQNCPLVYSLQGEIETILRKYPELTREELIGRIQVGIQRATDCEECAIRAGLAIAAIEGTWVVAVVGCAGSLLGNPLCVGIVTGTKYAALALVALDLADCLEDCEDEDIPSSATPTGDGAGKQLGK